ncbi:MAG: hypothetical protein JWM16_2767 [Verrucomicrobiales bacterium]|nr:hypothetical protein [Verrucomicrobiales bacterium]
MKSKGCARLIIHPSQYPLGLGRELVDCVRKGTVNPKFLYVAPEQASHWLELRRAYSPFMKKGDTYKQYLGCFKRLGANLKGTAVHIIGLGCGGGEKEQLLVNTLQKHGCQVRFTALDVSIPLLVLAQQVVQLTGCTVEDSICADLPRVKQINELFRSESGPEHRVFTFFGMLPVLPPGKLLSMFRSFLKPGDYLLTSANLIPEHLDEASKASLLAQYDNQKTRGWLSSFLGNLGFSNDCGELVFNLLEKPAFFEIRAVLKLLENVTVVVNGQELKLKAGFKLHLFSSFRYRNRQVRQQLTKLGLNCFGTWESPSDNESILGFERNRGNPATKVRLRNASGWPLKKKVK